MAAHDEELADQWFDPFTPPALDERARCIHRMQLSGGPVVIDTGAYVATRHRDVTAIARDAASFRQGGFTFDEQDIDPDEKVLSELDGELHATVRRTFTRLITPRRLEAYAPVVTDAFESVADDIADRGTADFVEEVARPVPPLIIGRLADLDDDLLSLIRNYTDAFHGTFRTGVRPEIVQRFDAGIRALIATRRHAPGNDWLTLLLECVDHQGVSLTDDRLATMFAVDLVVGASHTTTHVLTQLFLHVLREPGLWQALRADRSLVPIAVEEALRLAPTLPKVLRRSVGPAVVGDVAIPADSLLILSLEGANRDPAVFDDPGRFDVHRGPTARRHLTFGSGAHHCIGAGLARLELRICLNVFLDRFTGLRLDAVYGGEDPINHLHHLVVIADPADRG